jgi:hypothetical protein
MEYTDEVQNFGAWALASDDTGTEDDSLEDEEQLGGYEDEDPLFESFDEE